MEYLFIMEYLLNYLNLLLHHVKGVELYFSYV